jgi:hypothetical protein
MTGDALAKIPAPRGTNGRFLPWLLVSEPPEKRVIFTGSYVPKDIELFPGPLASCADTTRTGVVHMVPQGVKAEVISCAKDGALEACPGDIEGLVAIPTVRAARVERASRIHTAFRIASIASLTLIIGLGTMYLSALAKALEVLRPKGQR